MLENKPIIINGVDVSECPRLIASMDMGYVCNCEEDKHIISSCKYRPDCYFKQLYYYKQAIEEIKEIANKNLQNDLCANCDGVGLHEGCKDIECSYYQMNKIIQKCEQKEKGLINNKKIINKLIKEVDQLKAENEELKTNALTRCPECGSEYLSPVGAELYDENKQVKEAKQQVEQKLKRIEEYCKEQNPKVNYAACKVLQIIDGVE